MSVGVNTETLVRVEEIQGRGRGLVSTQPLRGGQIVLIDSPILLYSALALTKQQHSTFLYCDKCFKTIQSASVSCPTCSHQRFCSPTCLSAALASSHTPWVCQSLSRLRDCQDFLQHHSVERQIQAQFLVAAYNLAFVSPSDFQILLSLQGRAEDEDPAIVQSLHSVISSLCPPPPIEGFSFSLELIAALVAKDRFNAFGLMEPLNLNEENGGQRSVRAYGIYPKASLFNHDCLPNACRFDYVDTNNSGNTDIVVRMIHDVPQGREICLSYFPVNSNYSTRRKRLLEDYGFTCDCDRCKVEATWSDDEGDGDDNDNEVMEEDVDEPMEAESDGEEIGNDNSTDFPHAYFFLRYMCNRNNCWGTLAPFPPSDAKPSNLLECNACGDIKNDEVC
uniref:SET domain-containing protein n=1 Tax=Populus trichocarpa TaxID=3694 RepID=B9GMX2_POPTR|eukprot:XP_024451005.1 histone-lysine N-methyltransferase ASHR2 [Populus trichocarpa]